MKYDDYFLGKVVYLGLGGSICWDSSVSCNVALNINNRYIIFYRINLAIILKKILIYIFDSDLVLRMQLVFS